MKKYEKTLPASLVTLELEFPANIELMHRLAAIAKREKLSMPQIVSFYLEEGLSNPKIPNLLALASTMRNKIKRFKQPSSF